MAERIDAPDGIRTGDFCPSTQGVKFVLCSYTPGHGLLLYFAARDGGAIEGWDVSDEILQKSAECAARLGVAGELSLVRRNILGDLPPDTFESLVISEVLEHLERLGDAIDIVRRLLASTGIAFINVPLNAPSIDHISLF